MEDSPCALERIDACAAWCADGALTEGSAFFPRGAEQVVIDGAVFMVFQQYRIPMVRSAPGVPVPFRFPPPAHARGPPTHLLPPTIPPLLRRSSFTR